MGKTVHFADKYGSVDAQVSTAKDAPTISSIQQTQVAALMASNQAVEISDTQAVQLPGGQAVRVDYASKLGPQPSDEQTDSARERRIPLLPGRQARRRDLLRTLRGPITSISGAICPKASAGTEMETQRAVLEAHDLYRFFHTPEAETLALRGVSMQLQRGETVAVMGAVRERQIYAAVVFSRTRPNPTAVTLSC